MPKEVKVKLGGHGGNRFGCSELDIGFTLMREIYAAARTGEAFYCAATSKTTGRGRRSRDNEASL
ncbi:hypothetical protein [Cupriavidus pauculus]|uniref:hypothetical protein n=1 Tax=Cupriavidus pauculus TaxID=82633 RepID=UPI001EE26CC2|nr:hypothetical protein [Cupriavidus pauculus]GJG93210.1 hypothetical protein CBA19C6_01995 [Cupriavidus pauculus]